MSSCTAPPQHVPRGDRTAERPGRPAARPSLPARAEDGQTRSSSPLRNPLPPTHTLALTATINLPTLLPRVRPPPSLRAGLIIPVMERVLGPYLRGGGAKAFNFQALSSDLLVGRPTCFRLRVNFVSFISTSFVLHLNTPLRWSPLLDLSGRPRVGLAGRRRDVPRTVSLPTLLPTRRHFLPSSWHCRPPLWRSPSVCRPT